MKASSFEYRFRYLIHCLIFVLGFTAPWNYGFPLDQRGSNPNLWGQLAALISRSGVLGIQAAFNGLLVLAIVLAVAGALLRTWGSAYLGASVVSDPGMHTGLVGVVSAGPFRHVRNPLYLGTILHALALAILMPASGAVVSVLLIILFQFRLIFAEEPFLASQLGASYAAYLALVPRLVPSLRPRIAASSERAAWPQAFLGEIGIWGVAGSFAVAGWWYNSLLLIQCVLVSLGVSIMVTALVQGKSPSAGAAV